MAHRIAKKPKKIPLILIAIALLLFLAGLIVDQVDVVVNQDGGIYFSFLSSPKDECKGTLKIAAPTHELSEKQTLPSGSKNGCSFNASWNGPVTFQFGEKNKYNPIIKTPEWDGVALQRRNDTTLDFVEFVCKHVDFNFLEFNERYADFPRGVKVRSCENTPVIVKFTFTGELQ